MKNDPFLREPNYRPDRLFNDLGYFFKVDCLAQIAARLNVDASQVCRQRNRKEMLSDRMIIRILDRTGWSISHVRERSGLPPYE